MDYRLLFEGGAEAMLVVTADGDVLDANLEARRITRKGLESMRAAGRDGIFDPADPKVRSAFEELRRTGGFKGRLGLLRWYGVPFPAEVSMAALEEGFVSVVFKDLAGREGSAREVEGWLGLLVRESPDLIIVTEPDGAVRYVSPSIERVLGYRPGQFSNAAAGMVEIATQLFHPDDRDGTVSKLAEASKEPGLSRGPAVRVRHRDGSWRRMEWVVNNLSDDPEVGGLVFVSQDVTERALAEEKARRLNERLEEQIEEHTARLELVVAELEAKGLRLRESEERFRASFDLAAVGIAHVGTDGKWLRANRRLCEILGYAEGDLLQKTFRDITFPDDLKGSLALVERARSGETDDAYPTEQRYLRRDGSVIWAALTVSLVRGPSGDPSYFIAVIDDIDERKRAELLVSSLTPREVEVLKLLAQGSKNREIARALFFSTGTAKANVQRVIAKLGVSGRARAAARAVELGLVQPRQPTRSNGTRSHPS